MRLRPNVKRASGGRSASFTAARARPMAPASVSMWAASEIRATELAISPAATSTAMKPRLIHSATHSHRGAAAAETAWPWSWCAPTSAA